MRFLVAIVSFVIAFVMIGFGIAQRTVFAEPDRVSASVQLKEDAPITVIDGETLNAMDGRQKIDIGGNAGDTVFAAYGRTNDVLAWVDDTSYNSIGFNEETGKLTQTFERGVSDEAPSAAGSDLWLGEYSHADSLEFTLNVPSGISVLIMTDGVEPAPAEVEVTWPLDNRTPWSGPLILGGVLFLLLGLGLYLWALAHLRKARGPRRKPPKQPRLPKQPKDSYRKVIKAVRPKPKAVEKPRGRRSSGRMTAIVPVMLVSAVVLSGCSAESWPDFLNGNAAPTPTPSASALADEEGIDKIPVVSVPQLEGIMKRVSTVAGQADADRDDALVETRFMGAALQLRQSNYAIRQVDNSVAAPAAIPPGPVAVTLPQQTDTWPRTVFTIVQEPAAATPDPTDTTPAPSDEAAPAEPAVIPTALMLVQETPRENYKVAYAVALEGNTVLPELAPASVGAVRLDPELKTLAIPAGELPAAYADVLMQGQKSAFFEKFDLADDKLMAAAGPEKKAARQAELPTTAELTFASVPGVGETIPLLSNESGAIVAVNIGETETVKPVEAGAQLNPAGQVKSLSGVSSTTKGVVATYSYQLLFYVPPASSTDLIRLLGFSEGLISAKEL